MRRVVNWSLALAAIAGLMVAADAHAQRKGRQEDYQKKLQAKLDSMLGERMTAYATQLSEAGGKLKKKDRWKCEVRMTDSADYKDKADAEISLTMPTDEFKEFAPIAVLEAVAVPHNFPAGKIYVRETGSRRVGSIDYRAADPIGNKYRTGEPKAMEKAIAEMEGALKWH
ncbi:MAG: hypothetical protein V3V11_09155 [Vicinamibacteria bacterium]